MQQGVLNMTREELVAILSKRIVSSTYDNSTWSDLVSAIQTFTTSDKAKFMDYVISKNRTSVGNMVINALSNYKRDLDIAAAKTQVESDLSDDSLNLTEIEKYL